MEEKNPNHDTGPEKGSSSVISQKVGTTHSLSEIAHYYLENWSALDGMVVWTAIGTVAGAIVALALYLF